MLRYKRPEEVTVSAQVSFNDISGGISNAVLTAYNFITTGGYAPTGSTGLPCDDETKGRLVFQMQSSEPANQNVQIYVAGQPVDATEVPLNVYAVDGTEPWLSYNGPVNPGIYTCRIIYRKANMANEVIDEWQEKWD